MSIVGLERALHQYTLEPSESPFDLKSVPLAVQPAQEMKAGNCFLCVYMCVCVCVCVCKLVYLKPNIAVCQVICTYILKGFL